MRKTVAGRRKRTLALLSGIALISLFLLAFGAVNDFKYSKSLDIFFSLFRELNMYYVDETDPEKLVKKAIDEMLESLDPYTTFVPESDLDDLAFLTTGQYGGIGSLVRKSGDHVVISDIYKDFPADKAGLKIGDLIMEVDGQTVRGLSLSTVSDLLKGLPGSPVKITVQRVGMEKVIRKEIIRQKIQINPVPYYGMLDEETGYIRLSNFTQNSGKEFRQAFLDLKKSGNPSALVIDLRSNPGGLLVEAVDVTNIFVEKGQEIVSTRGKIKQWDHTYRARFEPLDTRITLAVLVNRGSASAAEIVAGALQDLDRAVVVGQRTFGKGLVQTTRSLSYNSKLKVTTAKYYIPSGRCIQALDYTHRNEDGSVGHIPDSLITAFKTINGRTVYDGGGIQPDQLAGQDSLAKITVQLYTGYHLFDYASKFASENEQIAPPGDFLISDSQFRDFISFLKARNFKYQTQTGESLNRLVASAKNEQYFDRARTEIESLRQALEPDLEKDLMTFRPEISALLVEEIAGRYYYEPGRIRSSLPYDRQLKEAVQILKDRNLHSSILQGNVPQASSTGLQR